MYKILLGFVSLVFILLINVESNVNATQSKFPWTMFLPAITKKSTLSQPVSYWGVENGVCCNSSSSTFYFSLSGMTKSSSLSSCSGTPSWEGWAATTPGAKVFLWEWASSSCTAYTGNFPYTLVEGKYYGFKLGWNGSSFTMTVYTNSGASSNNISMFLNAGSREIAKGSWERIDEIVLEIPKNDIQIPVGIMRAVN